MRYVVLHTWAPQGGCGAKSGPKSREVKGVQRVTMPGVLRGESCQAWTGVFQKSLCGKGKGLVGARHVHGKRELFFFRASFWKVQ